MTSHALIIEDEIIIALEIEDALRDLGYASIDIAMSPDEAVAAAQAHTPDLITADVRINNGTGPEAVAAIHRAQGAIPVVYVSGNLDLLPCREKAICVDKPITPSALRAAVLRAADACA